MAQAPDPVSYFLEDMSHHGRSQRTIAAYERVLGDFRDHLEESTDADMNSTVLGNATHRDCLEWIHDHRGRVAPSTLASYASYLHRFYSYMVEVGEFDRNPMTLVIEEMDERIETDPNRRDISIPEMRSFVDSVAHPGERAVIVTLLKTGIRAGELCNLDLRDIHLAASSMPTGPTRPELRGRPNSLYVSAKPRVGETINGEQRTESNKRERSTVIPIDEELGSELERWLAIRPDTPSEADPLFVSTDRNWGERLTGTGVHHIVERHASARGWHEPGGGAETNVTPHYFRHFFTTHLRDRTGDRGIVKYLRGDVAEDIIDTYTHNWGDRVREVYEENIYGLLGQQGTS